MCNFVVSCGQLVKDLLELVSAGCGSLGVLIYQFIKLLLYGRILLL